MIYALAASVAIFAYLLGSISTSIILSKSIYGTDIRTSGSGNAGATNMLRTHGKGIAIATLVCDVLKGTIAVVLAACIEAIAAPTATQAALLTGPELFLSGSLKYIAGVFAVFGHDIPVFFGFRGGKGVATSLGVALALNWQVGLIICVVSILIMIFTRYVSLGSVMGAGMYPFIIFTYLLASGADIEDGLGHIIMAIILAALLIGKHHTNIRRLANGTENKLFAKKQEVPEATEETNKEE